LHRGRPPDLGALRLHRTRGSRKCEFESGDLVNWERPEGGEVVNVGTIRGLSLKAVPALAAFVRNVLEHFDVAISGVDSPIAMSTREPPVKLSPIDTARWGVTTAKAPDLRPEDVPAALAFCREHGVGFLMARCSTRDLPAAQAMERSGFELMDTLVYYALSLEATLPDDAGSTPIRDLRVGEESLVREVAGKAFQGYLGHYHADPRLDRRQCDEAYVDWAHKSCLSKEVADAVLVADLDGAVAGFATLRCNSETEGEGVLFGVAPEAQGRGIYRSLMISAMKWCTAHGRKRMVVSTQITNIAVQKVWSRLGFEPWVSYYTFHKWV
jgi:GNAT superfamily N-acetyltransferase